jgi:transcriptional regulator with XRE-family HTH domain
MTTLGSRIKLARGKTSQEAFAKNLQISKGALGFYERDENLPNSDVLLKICSTAGVGLNWLLTGEGAMRPGYQEVMPKQSISATTLETHCSNCLELYKRLDTVNERLHMASERERTLLKENSVLKDEIRELQARLSPSASDKESLGNTA